MAGSSIVIIGTGGTIAGLSQHDGQDYRAGALSLTDMLQRVPELSELKEQIVLDQLFSLDSTEVDLPEILTIARHCQNWLDRGVDGIVVTHGTDTMEDTAFVLDLLLDTDIPVIITGAMRPADAISADGPRNLVDALVAAGDPASRGVGVLVSLDGYLFAARDLRKSHSTRVSAFTSEFGPVGEVNKRWVRILRRPALRQLPRSLWPLDADAPLPGVEVLHSHAHPLFDPIPALIDAGARGIVHAGPGAGNIAVAVREQLAPAVAAGLVVVRTSRVASGGVYRNGALDDDAFGYMAANHLTPAKARLLLSLALAAGYQPDELQGLFDQV